MMLCYHNHINITYYTESSKKVILQADYLGIYLTSFYKILDSLYDRRVEQNKRNNCIYPLDILEFTLYYDFYKGAIGYSFMRRACRKANEILKHS